MSFLQSKGFASSFVIAKAPGTLANTLALMGEVKCIATDRDCAASLAEKTISSYRSTWRRPIYCDSKTGRF
jgi:hypothetical protein